MLYDSALFIVTCRRTVKKWRRPTFARCTKVAYVVVSTTSLSVERGASTTSHTARTTPSSQNAAASNTNPLTITAAASTMARQILR